MPIVQFRVHPGVGCARMGNSLKAYYLAGEFPYFLTEEFPNLRLKPQARTHPRAFFANDTAASGTGSLSTYNIFMPSTFLNRFKEPDGLNNKIFPQAVRFRVFAYVYDDDVDKRRPQTVFEVTADVADITWKVNIANTKSRKSIAPVIETHENAVPATTTTDLSTADTSLLCKRIRPVSGLPNLAYMFLERDLANTSKVTGRLHVIGNEGGFVNRTPKGDISGSLWSDDWYDSAGDGFVQATIKPKAALRTRAGVSNVADLKYFDYGTAAPKAGTTAEIKAMPGWVVLSSPDFVPDMGFFVSVYDMAFSRAFRNLETRSVAAQTGRHKLILKKSEFDTYKKTDYMIHIHPQMCLFEDVRFVSGEAIGKDTDPALTRRGHNVHPGTAPPAADPDPKKTEKAAIAHGNVKIQARTSKADLRDPKKLKDADPAQPIAKWLKRAVFSRLRKPWTLYDKKRQFLIRLPGSAPGSDVRRPGTYPRKVGRRMDYEKSLGQGDKNKMYEFPDYSAPDGNLRIYHGLQHSGQLCGGVKSPPTAGPPGSTLTTAQKKHLQSMDDMYWPATFADMPMLRELAYTMLQYNQFEVWQGKDADVRMDNIFNLIVSPALRASFAGAGDADKHFSDFLAARPLYAPAMIDLAHMGAMMGGSFMPGIEVGREAGIASNWSVFHGATRYFPSLRFKPANKDEEHVPAN